jgi:sporulation protein YlmC with PRC-barrel domain
MLHIMLVSLQDIIGTPVLSQRDGHRIGTIKLPLIDPETGKLLALVVKVLKRRIIVPYDILKWGKSIEVHDGSAIIDADEILRVHSLLENYNPLIGRRVETKSGIYLGKVFDYELDTQSLSLNKLMVAKEFIIFKYSPSVVTWKHIIEIQDKKIIVKDRGVKALAQEEELKRARMAVPV